MLLFSSICSFNTSAQDSEPAEDSESSQDYAEIIFLPNTYKWLKGEPFRLYLNNELVVSMKHEEILRYKIHSKGRIIVSYYFKASSYAAERYENTIEIDENKTYYYVVGRSVKKQKNQLISESDAEQIMDKLNYSSTIELEEDITKPIGKISANITKRSGGSGTGFLLSDKGYIVTNFHVIDGAETITVKGINGEYGSSFEASVVSLDHANDLAILKVNSTLINFPTPPYAIESSKVVKKGEKAFALGYPRKDLMGNELKVTNGIINAESGYKGSVSQFQFSAAVQPGNSGGPLINSKGNIIGIVSSKLNSNLAEAAGYAIKSDYLSFFMDQSKKVDYVPTKNTMEGEDLPEQLEKISKFIYIIETK
jgi:S1-C subfamily serine protease